MSAPEPSAPSQAEADPTMDSSAGAPESMEDLLARHRKENKDLQHKITSLKKQSSGDKKKKKELTDQIAKMEEDIKARHAKEKAECEARGKEAASAADAGNGAEETTNGDASAAADKLASLELDSDNDDAQAGTTGGSPAKKRNRQKERKERKQAQMEEERRKAAEEAKQIPDYKKLEDEAIRRIVEREGLALKEIAADGHCLYNAIADQIPAKSHNHISLRKLAAEEMRAHADDYMPFMTDDNGDMLDQAGFEKYLSDLVETPVWGGDLEIRALANALSRQILVYQQSAPTLKIGEEFGGEPVRLSYHRHQLALGAHYNALRKRDTT